MNIVTLEELLPEGKESYSCADLARIVGRHPNTLRKQELSGFISPLPRKSNGYRHFTRKHALEALFSARALRAAFEEWRGRERVKAMIRTLVSGDYRVARELVLAHRRELRAALRSALAARSILESWRRSTAPRGGHLRARSSGSPRASVPIWRGEAARRIGVAPDTLRDWERNGLVRPARLPNGRRVYSAGDLEKLEIIKVLRDSGYSLVGLVHLVSGATATEDLTFARDRWDLTLRRLIDDSHLLEAIVATLDQRAKTSPNVPHKPKRTTRSMRETQPKQAQVADGRAGLDRAP